MLIVKKLKADYSTFQRLKENSGFGWNKESDLPTAVEGVWDDYITKHPEAAKFCQKPFPFYSAMSEICSGHTATGHYASTAAEAMVEKVEHQIGSDDSGSTTRDTPAALDFMFRGDRWDESRGIETIAMSEGHTQGKGKGKRISEEKLENSSIVRPKRERKGAGIAIANALEKLNATASSAQISKQEEAVRDLQVQYGDIMSMEELVDAMSVMESEIKARLYLVASSELQAKWLRQEIQKLRNLGNSSYNQQLCLRAKTYLQ